jgi:hypothetical protein
MRQAKDVLRCRTWRKRSIQVLSSCGETWLAQLDSTAAWGQTTFGCGILDLRSPCCCQPCVCRSVLALVVGDQGNPDRTRGNGCFHMSIASSLD